MRHAVRRADLPAVSETRGVLRDHLRRWGVPALSDTAELLTTELLTNALRHTAGGAVVTATLSAEPGHRLRIEVSDSAARRPRVPSREDHQATSGRGLVLVDALADAWGARPTGRGKVVWFELNAAPHAEAA